MRPETTVSAALRLTASPHPAIKGRHVRATRMHATGKPTHAHQAAG
ncbi:hypothetical protein [Streptomyces sp. NPDC005336]